MVALEARKVGIKKKIQKNYVNGRVFIKKLLILYVQHGISLVEIKRNASYPLAMEEGPSVSRSRLTSSTEGRVHGSSTEGRVLQSTSLKE